MLHISYEIWFDGCLKQELKALQTRLNVSNVQAMILSGLNKGLKVGSIILNATVKDKYDNYASHPSPGLKKNE